jgi:hypothetical protein
MASGTFDVKFPYGTQFTFGSLTFATEGGGWKSPDAAPRASIRAPHVGIWTSSIFPSHLIYVKRCLLRSGYLCRATYLQCQARSGHSDRDVDPLAIGWSIELVFIDSVPRSKFS